MHGTEHRVSERRALRLSAPRHPVYPASASSLPDAPQPLCLSKTGPFARNGLSLAHNDLRLREFHSGVKGPGLLFRSLACRSSCPFGFSAPPPAAGLPQLPAASTPQTRCILYRHAMPAVPPTSAPLREFLLPRDQRLDWLRNRSVRLPDSPDLRSLPAAFSFKRFGYGSSFPIRYISGGLLFLKPLGTFFTMIRDTIPVNAFFLRCRPFQQLPFALFRNSYSNAPVDHLCIKQAVYLLLVSGCHLAVAAPSRISFKIMPLSVASHWCWPSGIARMVRSADAR